MDVSCPQCQTEYEFEDARIPDAGLSVKCTECAKVFRINKPVKTAKSAPGREWRLRQADGSVFAFKRLTTLQKWIVEEKVTRDDEISLTGGNWKKLSDVAELASFFHVVDAALAKGQSPSPEQPRPEIVPEPGVQTLEPVKSPPRRPSQPLPSPGEVLAGGPLPVAAAGPASARVSPEPKLAAVIQLNPGGNSATWLSQRRAATGGAVDELAGLSELASAPLAAVPPAPPAPVVAPAPLVPSPPPSAPRQPVSPTVAMAASTVEALRQATSQPLPPMSPPAGGAGRSPALVASVATAVVLLLGGGGWYVLRYVPEQARLEAERNAAADAAEKARLQAEADAQARLRQAEEDARVRAQLEEKLRQEAAEREAALDAGAGSGPDAGAVAELPPKGGPAKVPPAPKGYNALLDEADRVRQRAPARALALYEQAESLKPSAVDPPVGRGYALLDLGRAAESEVAFRQALTLNPTYAPALMGSAEAFKAQGKREQAIKMYERYLDVLPDGAEANVARTNIQRLKR